MHLKIVHGDPVGTLAGKRVGQGAVVFERQRRTRAVEVGAIGEEAGDEFALGVFGELAEFLVWSVAIRIHGVLGGDVVDERFRYPSGHVETAVVALLQRLWDADSQLKVAAPAAAGLVQHVPHPSGSIQS